VTAAAYALRLADDGLVLGQRLCEWASRAPELEEDVALLNIALDQLGAARSLLTYAGSSLGRDEDQLAFLRDEHEFTNALVMELACSDFGQAMARQLVVAAYQLPLWEALSTSTDETLAGVAGKSVKEVAYHLDHASSWVIRLGDGTDESHLRMQQGLDEVWPYAFELFERDALLEPLIGAGIAADPALLEPIWTSTMERVLTEATLDAPETDWRPTGGREGRHTEPFGYLLAELQHLHRSHPGASW
jgi:ring-1,2-phenylacetyl-CoA epoxidase subunit PaaC